MEHDIGCGVTAIYDGEGLTMKRIHGRGFSYAIIIDAEAVEELLDLIETVRNEKLEKAEPEDERC